MTSINQFSAHIGLDWADKKHDVCVKFKNGEANALMATALATQIKVVSEIIKIYDERIDMLFDTLPVQGCLNHFRAWGRVWAHVCLLHLAITVAVLIAPKQFKTTQGNRTK